MYKGFKDKGSYIASKYFIFSIQHRKKDTVGRNQMHFL